MHRRAFLAAATALLAALPLLTVPVALAAQQDAQEATVVYLVRHAERAEDGTDDPPISEAGWARSRLLAAMLKDAAITAIHSTDYRRTRSTAEPTAEAAGLTIRHYDAGDLAALAEQLRRTPGRHLVVGHSNTTPPLVTALGGDPAAPIEEMEYDRLYIVTLTKGGASTVLIHFGNLFEG